MKILIAITVFFWLLTLSTVGQTFDHNEKFYYIGSDYKTVLTDIKNTAGFETSKVTSYDDKSFTVDVSFEYDKGLYSFDADSICIFYFINTYKREVQRLGSCLQKMFVREPKGEYNARWTYYDEEKYIYTTYILTYSIDDEERMFVFMMNTIYEDGMIKYLEEKLPIKQITVKKI